MLNSNEVRLDQRDVVNLTECPDNTGVVDTGDEDGKEIGQQGWLLLEIERQSLVVAV